MTGTPDRERGEDAIAYARRLVAASRADETVRVQISLSAGTLVELARRLPAGVDAQTALRMMLGYALLDADPALEDVVDLLEAAVGDLDAIRESVANNGQDDA